MNGFLKGCAVGGAMGALVLATGAALAGTGVGGVFNLGVTNTVNQPTTLAGSTDGVQAIFFNNSALGTAIGAAAFTKSPTAPALFAQNLGGGPALGLKSGQGHAPLTVDSTTKVASLNADLLDGSSSSAFFPNSNARRVNLHMHEYQNIPIAIGELRLTISCLPYYIGAKEMRFKTTSRAGELQLVVTTPSDVSGPGHKTIGSTDNTSYGWLDFNHDDGIMTFVFSTTTDLVTGTLAFHFGIHDQASANCWFAGTLTRATAVG